MLEAIDNRSLKSQMEDDSISTNSYKLGPDENTRFNPQKARVLLDNVLKSHLESFTYDAGEAGAICKTIVNDVTTKASKLGFNRYRYVCHIDMFTTLGQAVKAVSRFLWDKQTDNYVTSQFVDRVCCCLTRGALPTSGTSTVPQVEHEKDPIHIHVTQLSTEKSC